MSETTLLYAFTIVLIILVAFAFYQKCFDHVDALLWENKSTYISLIQKYGLPTILDQEKGGGAMWNITDQRLNYFDKKDDIDAMIHLWTPIKLFPTVDPSNVKSSEHGRHRRISDILDILPHFLSYDPVRGQVMARFSSLPIAQALTMLAMKITTGELTLQEIKSNELVLKYASQITPGTSNYDPILVRKTDNYIQEYLECFVR